MGTVLLAALIWPIVLLGIGLLIGRTLRRGDRLGELGQPVTASSPDAPDRPGSDDDRSLPAAAPGAGAG